MLEQVGLTAAEVEDMYRVLAIANYEDRFVIPTTHREYAENAFDLRGSCGFSFGNGCSGGTSRNQPVRRQEEAHDPDQGGGLSMSATKLATACTTLRVLAALLGYPDARLRERAARDARRAARRSARCRRRAAPNCDALDRLSCDAPTRSSARRATSSCSTAAAPPRCICSSMCTAIRASAARR